MPVWTAVSYNPLSLKRTHRLQQILQEFQWYSLVGLQGTQRRTEHAVEQYTCGSHVLLEWGCQASDKAAGVALALRAKVFQQRNVVWVYTPPAAFQGRMGAVRVRRGDCDSCPIVAYVPVEPHTQSQRSYNERLWAWVRHLLDSLPSRCVPILLLDANGRTGTVQSAATGAVQPQRQNCNGSLLHHLLLHHHMFAVNTFHPAEDTYFGCFGRNSRIDYVCLPQSMHPVVRQCTVLHAAGDRLQLNPSQGRRDHRPALVRFEHALSYQACDTRPRWDHMLLAQGVLHGRHREVFLAKVESLCQKDAEWAELEKGPPGPMWDKLNRIARESGEQFYSRKACKQQQPHDTAAAAEDVCKARADLAAMPARSISSRHHTHQDLHDMLVQWRAVAKQRKRQRELDALAKRDRQLRQAQLLDEYAYAWYRKDLAHMWATARQMSGNAIGNPCIVGQMRMNGNTSSSSQAQRADVMPKKLCGRSLTASRTRAVKPCSMILRQQLRHLLIFMLCDDRFTICVSESLCLNGLAQQSCGGSCCTLATREVSCAEVWVSERHVQPRSCNVLWSSYDPSENMAVHPQSGTAALPCRSANTMVRMAPKASGSSIPSTLLVGLSTAICGKRVGIPPTEIMQQAMHRSRLEPILQQLFVEVHNPCLDRVRSRLAEVEPPGMFVTWDVVNNQSVDVSLSSYADDVANRLTGHSALDMADKNAGINAALDHELGTAGLAQNRDKQEHSGTCALLCRARNPRAIQNHLPQQHACGKGLS